MLELLGHAYSHLEVLMRNSSTGRKWIHRVRMAFATVFSAGAVPLMFILPGPAVQSQPGAQTPLAADSSVTAMMALNRSGRWAEAEATGLRLLARRPASAAQSASCAVLIGVTYAHVRQQHHELAVASMARFDRVCTGAAYLDFIPAESDRVRRVVRGEDVSRVYSRTDAPLATDVGGATAVMMADRAGRYAEAEQIGAAFMANMERRPGEPEACAVLIAMTYAQAAQRRTVDAKQTLARFDRECAGVGYLDWFPAEANRVRRVVNGEAPSAVYQRRDANR
jgi:hypothetical protein